MSKQIQQFRKPFTFICRNKSHFFFPKILSLVMLYKYVIEQQSALISIKCVVQHCFVLSFNACRLDYKRYKTSALFTLSKVARIHLQIPIISRRHDDMCIRSCGDYYYSSLCCRVRQSLADLIARRIAIDTAK